MDDISFSQIDFGPFMRLLEDDDITDISYSNNGQLWVKTLSSGVHPEAIEGLNNEVVEKLAFQCSNVMGKTFNMAHPLLDAESAELRLNFVHDSIATNGIALLIRKTPAKIRLKKEKLIEEEYVPLSIHEFLMTCVAGHCNIIVSGETGSGKTELVKYLASHIAENEKIITIEDTLELHLDKIYPTRDIVAMKTNNIASYSDVLVACMRQNPRWILLSEVRSGEAVMAVRNSISSGHNILSTIHADKASSIPMRLYSLLETSQDIDQFVKSMHRYIQLGVHVKGFFSKKHNRFQREITQVVEFYVDDENNIASSNVLYGRDLTGNETFNNPTIHLIDYLASQGVVMQEDPFVKSDKAFGEVKEENNEVNNVLENQQVINNESLVNNDSVLTEEVVPTQIQSQGVIIADANTLVDNTSSDGNIGQVVSNEMPVNNVLENQQVVNNETLVNNDSVLTEEVVPTQIQSQGVIIADANTLVDNTSSDGNIGQVVSNEIPVNNSSENIELFEL